MKVSVQFYVRHGDRKFMELLQFTALENVFPNEKSCSSVVFEPPQYWDVEGEVMRYFIYFLTSNSIEIE